MEKSKISVLCLASWFPTVHSPQNGDFIERMCKAVTPYCDLHLLHVGEGPVDKMQVLEMYDEFYRILVIVPYRKNSNVLLRFFQLYRGYCKGMKVLSGRGKTFSMVHLHVIYPLGILYLISRKLSRFPLIITEHSTRYAKKLSGKFNLIESQMASFCVKRAEFVLPVSETLMEGMKENGFYGRYKIIPNVVDLKVFSPPKRRGDQRESFTFIVIAGLKDEIKNVSGIVQAFSQVCPQYPTMKLKIAGDGADREELETLVGKLELKMRIEFTGELPHSDIPDLMRESDCLIVFSQVETFSCVIAEAFSVGLPIISSKCGGLTPFIQPDEGLLVERGDINGLSAAMKQMFGKYEDFKPFVRRSIALSFSPELVGKSLNELYEACSDRMVKSDFN